MRIIGEHNLLGPGEGLPGDVAARYAAQFNDFITFVEGTATLATDAALAPNAEVEVLKLTPLSNESYEFRKNLMASVSNYTPAYGDLALRFFLVNKYLETLTDLPGPQRGGIDVLACSRPPSTSAEMEGYTLDKTPVIVGPNLPFSVFIRNTKGTNITPTGGTALSFTVTLVAIYRRTGT
jgi:hypothetical protein